ncbi:hypothetical protein OF83DRAFT_1147491 [Amylostereum chailletii]|nr:hypothetical protein OF83DRAFT_1147491 [Amylostereum chailletii]
MEEMLLTWRIGAPNGRIHAHRILSKPQVLSELEFALGQKERNLHADTYTYMTRHLRDISASCKSSRLHIPAGAVSITMVSANSLRTTIFLHHLPYPRRLSARDVRDAGEYCGCNPL